MTLYGPDVSEWQDGLDLAALPADFYIIRLNYGADHPDLVAASHHQDAARTGRPIGFYTYLVPGEDIAAQAECAARVWRDCGASGGVWIDVEDAGLSGADVDRMADELAARGVPVIGPYTYASRWESLAGGEPDTNRWRGLWVANYARDDRAGDARAIYPGAGGGGWTYPVGNRRPALLQYTQHGTPPGGAGIDWSAYEGSPDELAALLGATAAPAPNPAPAPSPPAAGSGPVELVLDYSRAEIGQDTFYWCGPASTQTLINARTGELVPESVLASELGTTEDGTSSEYAVAPVLSRRIGGGYRVVELPDPPTAQQVEDLWQHVVQAVDASYGVSMNFVAPPSNYPRGSHGSYSPAYGGGTVYHYVACLGYAREDNGSRHLWIADSGFAPFGYWSSLEQVASIIGGKAYAWPADTPTPTSPEEDDTMTPEMSQRLDRLERTQQLILDQLVGAGTEWPQNGGRSLNDAVCAIGERVGAPGMVDPNPTGAPRR